NQQCSTTNGRTYPRGVDGSGLYRCRDPSLQRRGCDLMHRARRVASLPEKFYYRGEPTPWVRMTRPAQRLHSFLEGLVIAADGTFYLTDVPYGRIFKISPDLNEWSQLIYYDGEPHGLALSGQGELLVADYTRGILSADLSTGAITRVCNRDNDTPFKG